MASPLALQNFPGFCKEAIPQDWFPRGEEVTFCQQFKNNSKKTFLGFHWNNFGSCGIQRRCSHRRRQQDQHGETFLDDLVQRLGWPCLTSWMTMIIRPHFLLSHFWSLTSWRRARGSQTESLTNSPQSQIAFSAAGATFPLCLTYFSFSPRRPIKFKTQIMIS